MITTEILDAEKAKISAMEIPNNYKPNRSIPDFLQEAGDLIPVCERDKSELSRVNINWSEVERLEPAIEVLRDQESKWRDSKHDATLAREEWKTAYPEAVALKEDLLSTMSFVFYDKPDKLARLAEIREGNDQRDTIQDLNDLAIMGKSDPTPMEAINYDVSNFDKADAFANSLMLILGRINGDAAGNERKELRDKAFYSLSNLVTYIQRFGKYVFRNDPEKQKNYQRKYY